MRVITSEMASVVAGETLVKNRFVGISSGKAKYADTSDTAQFVTLEGASLNEGISVQEGGIAEVEYSAGTSATSVYQVEVTTDGKVKKLDVSGLNASTRYKYYELAEAVTDSAANDGAIVSVILKPKFAQTAAE